MKRLELSCKPCGYHTEVLWGSVGQGQTFSDVNEDFAYYKLFYCPVGKEILSIDINDRDFDGNCPTHRSPLTRIDTIPAKCPMCDAPMEVTEHEILSGEGGSAQ